MCVVLGCDVGYAYLLFAGRTAECRCMKTEMWFNLQSYKNRETEPPASCCGALCVSGFMSACPVFFLFPASNGIKKITCLSFSNMVLITDSAKIMLLM